MKWIEVDLKEDGGVKIWVSPIIRVMIFVSLGASFMLMSYNLGEKPTYTDITIVLLSILGSGFMTYGIIMFIRDIKKSNSLKDLKKRIKNNLNDVF